MFASPLQEQVDFKLTFLRLYSQKCHFIKIGTLIFEFCLFSFLESCLISCPSRFFKQSDSLSLMLEFKG